MPEHPTPRELLDLNQKKIDALKRLPRVSQLLGLDGRKVVALVLPGATFHPVPGTLKYDEASHLIRFIDSALASEAAMGAPRRWVVADAGAVMAVVVEHATMLELGLVTVKPEEDDG